MAILNKDINFKPTSGHIHLVIGSSRFGSQVAIKDAKAGKYVTVIDKDQHSSYKLGDNFPGSFVCGDATKVSTLEDANISKAKTVLIATNSDDVNVFVANLIYLKYKKSNVIVRIDDETKQKLIINPTVKIINRYASTMNQYLDFIKDN